MHHNMEIELRQQGKGAPVFRCRTKRIGLRLWRWLFGTEKVVILVPGGSVDTVTITEKGGGVGYEQGEAVAGCGGRAAVSGG